MAKKLENGDNDPIRGGLFIRGRIVRRMKKEFKNGHDWEKVTYELDTENGRMFFVEINQGHGTGPYHAVGTAGEWSVRIHMYTTKNGEQRHELVVVSPDRNGEF